jgi:hypothetical protein
MFRCNYDGLEPAEKSDHNRPIGAEEQRLNLMPIIR